MGETLEWDDECRRRQMTIVGGEGKGRRGDVRGGREGKVFPELGK